VESDNVTMSVDDDDDDDDEDGYGDVSNNMDLSKRSYVSDGIAPHLAVNVRLTLTLLVMRFGLPFFKLIILCANCVVLVTLKTATANSVFVLNAPVSSSRQHLSNDNCPVDKREDYLNCSVLCCV